MRLAELGLYRKLQIDQNVKALRKIKVTVIPGGSITVIIKVCRALVIFLLIFNIANCAIAKDTCADARLQYDLLIRPVSMFRSSFAVKGKVEIPAEMNSVNFARIPWQKFVYSIAGEAAIPDESGKITRPAALSEDDSWQIDFEGISSLKAPKSQADNGEIYCLNNCPPNPEILCDKAALYRVKFDLPQGYKAITFDSDVPSSLGLQFQIARFQEPVVRKTSNFTFEYVFPEGFSADESYLKFLENTMESWYKRFGDPGFNHVKIGVIRRGEAKGEINGSPCGNLILLSRSALGGAADLSGLAGLGIVAEDVDQFRKLVIAHELSHFWFGCKYLGADGWMVEGIPQYLGIYSVLMESAAAVKPLLKFTEYLDRMIPLDSIPNNPFSDDKTLYIKAYYQGSLALYRIGESVGHENLLEFIATVFEGNSNPDFSYFDQQFKRVFPDKHDDWVKAWRIKE